MQWPQNTVAQNKDIYGNPDNTSVMTSYTYDANGNVLTVVKGGVLTLTNTNDLLGNVLTSTDGNGKTATNTYNCMNLPRTTALPGDSNIGAYTVAYKYTKLWQPAAQTDSLGKQVKATYDNQGRALTATEQTSAGAQAITVSSVTLVTLHTDLNLPAPFPSKSIAQLQCFRPTHPQGA